jgi:acetolactate synthase-1/2/3 large subunit
MEMNGAEILVDFLQRQGVEVVAGMPGGAILPVYDALGRSPIRHVLVRHEQAAGFIAQGMARASGRPGVCLATSGPGATNLVTALADARMDSVPIVAITGQVPTTLLGTDAFQEVDAVGMCAPLVKHAVMVRRVEDLEAELHRAFSIAVDGRPGPVLIDLPKDVQQARLSSTERTRTAFTRIAHPARPDLRPDPAALAAIGALLERSERPVLYVGGGVAQAGGHHALSELARRQQIPVASSLMGLGCFDPEDPLWLGMLGMHGAPYTNRVMREADLLIAVGARFDDRATGKMSEFCPHARVVHADIDPRELGKLRAAEVAVHCDARALLEALARRAPSRTRPKWLTRVQALRQRHPMPAGRGDAHAVLDTVARHLRASTTVTTDVGQHQMWAAQQLPFRRPRQLLTSGGLGTMGFGLPAAIGAALATGEPAHALHPRAFDARGAGSRRLRAGARQRPPGPGASAADALLRRSSGRGALRARARSGGGGACAGRARVHARRRARPARAARAGTAAIRAATDPRARRRCGAGPAHGGAGWW